MCGQNLSSHKDNFSIRNASHRFPHFFFRPRKDWPLQLAELDANPGTKPNVTNKKKARKQSLVVASRRLRKRVTTTRTVQVVRKRPRRAHFLHVSKSSFALPNANHAALPRIHHHDRFSSLRRSTSTTSRDDFFPEFLFGAIARESMKNYS